MALTAQQQSIISQAAPACVVTTPKKLSPIQQMLLNDAINQEFMAEAIAEGVFYAEVIEDMSGSMNPGTVGSGDEVMPALYATLAEAQFENQGNIEEIERQKSDPNFDNLWVQSRPGRGSGKTRVQKWLPVCPLNGCF